MRKERTKKELTRKGKALRRTAVLILLLVILTQVFHLSLLPANAKHLAEQNFNCGRTETVQWHHSPKKGLQTSLFCFSENDNVMLFTQSRWNLLYGWLGNGYTVIDCSEPKPLYVADYSFKRTEEDAYAFFTFGRVEDPRIAAVEILLEEVDPTTWDRTELARYTTERSEWKEQNGRAFFLTDFDGTEGWPIYVEAFATALDSEGRELLRYDLQGQSWSWS